MSTTILIAVDLGTSGAKAAAVDSVSGTILRSVFCPYATTTLPDGGSEQDPADWLAAVRTVLAECAAAHSEITGLALTGQMQDLISLDAQGRELGPAVLYNDTRADAEAASLSAAIPDWGKITGNEQNATSNAAMFRRLDALGDPRARRANALLFSPTGYLLHRLGLGQVVDVTTASTTGLLDLHARAWSPEICAAAGIGTARLPTIREGYLGDTGAGATELLGLPAGVPVVLAPGDAAATTAGIVGTDPGNDYLYLGSSGWHARVLGDPGHAGPGTVHRLALSDGRYLRIAAILSAAATADWARESFLGRIPTVAADRLLEQRGRRGFSGVLSLPSLQGERFPVRDDRLGAALVGMTALHTPVDLYAAVLEGVALGLSHGMDLTETAPLAIVGGGTGSLPWLRIIADVTGREVRAVTDADAALTGAALAAVDALELPGDGMSPLRHRAAQQVLPDRAAHDSFAAVRPRHRRLYDALGDY